MTLEDKQKKRNHRLILVVLAMSVAPFIIALMFTKNPQWLSARSNKGELIIPPVTTERNELTGYDQFSIDNLTELNGHWVMMNIIPGDSCDDICREAIHNTRQLRLMMDKDLTRIRRVVVILGQIDTRKVGDWWLNDKRLIRTRPGAALVTKLKKIGNGEIPVGILILMDPFGNLMMRYESGFDPYDVKKDMKKLLRFSQIG